MDEEEERQTIDAALLQNIMEYKDEKDLVENRKQNKKSGLMNDLPPIETTKSSRHLRLTNKRKNITQTKSQIETRLTGKRTRSNVHKQSDSDEELTVPSVLDLLQKLRDSKILSKVEFKETPFEEKHWRFFDQAALEFQKAEQAMLRLI
jgi:adenine-specific DNA glycosylase